MPDKTKLTTKQQRFVDFYDGNATDAARKAGYKGNDVTLGAVGNENLKKPIIAAAIKAREGKRKNTRIATREDRQLFWSDTMNDYDTDIKDRLKASELMGRSEADFTDKVKDVSDKKKVELVGPLGALLGGIYVTREGNDG